MTCRKEIYHFPRRLGPHPSRRFEPEIPDEMIETIKRKLETAMNTPSIGRQVHFVLPDGQHRPATIVRVWPGSMALQLNVMLDGCNDGVRPGEAPIRWESSVIEDQTGKQVRTWHWPEPV